VPITLVVEDGTGLATANSLALASTVTALLAAHSFATAWTDKDADEQDVIVAHASAWMGRWAWQGTRLNGSQAMPFPRFGMETPDGFAVASNAVPAFALRVLALLCLYLAQQVASSFADTGLAPGSELEVGPIRLTPSSGASVVPPDARAEAAPYLVARNVVERA
jgi:hypothetical protein